MTVLPENILRLMSDKDRASLGKAGMTKAEAEARFVAKSEKQLQDLIAKELNRRGIWFHRAAMHKRTTGTVGTPDLLFAFNGIPCAVEVKYGKGQLRPEQETALKQMDRNGWRCCVVYTFDQFRNFIRSINNENIT